MSTCGTVKSRSDQDKMTDTRQANECSPVNEMFNGRSVFITGASGFIGRVLLEKLLRCYPGIRRIYILMRTKKNQQPYERLHKQLLKAPIFDKLRAMQNSDKLLDKIVVIAGDIAEPELGISKQDMQMMLQDASLSIVIHSAATIKFDEPLKVSVNLNLIATKTIIGICRKLPNLISFCHVSTAFVNSHIDADEPIEECLYPIDHEPEKVMKLAELLDVDLMNKLSKRLVDKRPNTYTYSKALAEHLIEKEASDLPVVIVRPSTVLASWKDPISGWVDNLNGPTGLILALGNGLLRSMHADSNAEAPVIPVDVVVNTIIASTFYAHSKLQIHQASKEVSNGLRAKHSRTPIFHCTSCEKNPITWGRLTELSLENTRRYPSSRLIRYPEGTIKSSKCHDVIVRIFIHYLLAFLVDIIYTSLGQRPQLVSTYSKLHNVVDTLANFCERNFRFRTANFDRLQTLLDDHRDRQELFMNINDIDWSEYWKLYVLGARRHILKESDSTLDAARTRMIRFHYLEVFARILLGSCMLIFVVILYSRM